MYVDGEVLRGVTVEGEGRVVRMIEHDDGDNAKDGACRLTMVSCVKRKVR